MYHKKQSYDVWILRYGAWGTKFFVILEHFLPPNNPKNQNFEKMKKIISGDIIILHMSTINDNHMMYDSWDIKHNRHNFLSFWTIFYTFTPLPGIFSSTFLLLVNSSKNSILNWVFTSSSAFYELSKFIKISNYKANYLLKSQLYLLINSLTSYLEPYMMFHHCSSLDL